MPSGEISLAFRAGLIFFDSRKVERALDPVKRQFLARSGALARLNMKKLLSKSAGPRWLFTKAGRQRLARMTKQQRQRWFARIRKPLPGQPPLRRIGTLQKRVFFALDPATESVVIGPEVFSTAVGDKNVPRLLEIGGQATRFLRDRKTRRRRMRRVRYRRHPYLDPSLEQTRPRLPDLWRQSILNSRLK